MAREGHGFSQFVRNDEDPGPLVDRFYRRLNMPVFTSIEADWGDLQVIDPLPASVPDLFDRQPVFLIGRYSEPGSGTFHLRGRQGASWASIPVEVELPAVEKDNASLRLLWARRQIANLIRLQVRREIPEVRAEILALALEHSLMSKYTSFVAVERKLENASGLPLETVLIPSELPEGVSYEGNFGQANLSMERVKPGDPVLTVRAPEEALSVTASFPFGLNKKLERDPETGFWVCRFLVPRGEAEGRYAIWIRIVGDAQGEPVWEGIYNLPEWYRAGKYTFRFLAVDAARNTSSQNFVVEVPLSGAEEPPTSGAADHREADR